MKKLFLVLCVALIGMGSAFAQKGEQRVGLNLNYGTEISNVGLGAKYQYGITDAIRLEGSFDYFFKKDGASMWDINVNAHYLFPFAEKFAVYPLVGLTYANCKVSGGWSNDAFSSEEIQDMIDAGIIEDASEVAGESESAHESKFGVNLGAGVQYAINDRWGVNFEVKYQLISDFDQAVFGIGATYKF